MSLALARTRSSGLLAWAGHCRIRAEVAGTKRYPRRAEFNCSISDRHGLKTHPTKLPEAGDRTRPRTTLQMTPFFPAIEVALNSGWTLPDDYSFVQSA